MCDQCASFGHGSALEVQLTPPTGGEPYRGSECGEASYAKSNVSRHQRTHGGRNHMSIRLWEILLRVFKPNYTAEATRRGETL